MILHRILFASPTFWWAPCFRGGDDFSAPRLHTCTASQKGSTVMVVSFSGQYPELNPESISASFKINVDVQFSKTNLPCFPYRKRG